jgi:predicted PurR-regulated permease PerM
METGRRLNWLIAIALVGWLVYLLAPVLTPFVAAALLAYVGDPLADRLQKLKMPRTLAVVTVFLITFVLLALLILLIGPLIGAQVGALFDSLPEIVRQVEQVWLPSIMGWLNIDAGTDIGVGPFLAKYGEMFGSWSGKALVSVSKSGGVLAAAVFSLFLIPIITFYLLRDWDSIIAHLGALVPESQRETIYELARESFVPYLGFVFGILLAGMTVALEPNPLWSLVGVVATFSVGQLIEGSVLTPKLVGDRIGLHPVIIIFAVAAGGQLFGFFGILLALPAAAVLSVVVRFAFHRYLREHPEAQVKIELE